MSKKNSKHTFDNSDTNSDNQYIQTIYVVVKMTIPIKNKYAIFFHIYFVTSTGEQQIIVSCPDMSTHQND